MNTNSDGRVTIKNDTAGILSGSSADADWKTTLETARDRFAENQRRRLEEREEREAGKTIPEWELEVERLKRP